MSSHMVYWVPRKRKLVLEDGCTVGRAETYEEAVAKAGELMVEWPHVRRGDVVRVRVEGTMEQMEVRV